ncbi:MAG TPA: radical SAM protein, partial [Mycobacterium sp.]|nr:radical SAM protein [Mycobacterium sp.]
MTQAATRPTAEAGHDADILAVARRQVLLRGEGLSRDQVLEVLQLPEERLEELLALAHEVRMAWCGPEVEVEGIISLKTGGCPEDCHFCSQSGLFASPVRSAWLDIPSLVEAAKQTAKSGATEFCIVAAVRGPDKRLMSQVAAGIEAIRNEVEINIACSLGMLTAEQVDELASMGVHRYNHNLETAKSYFPEVVTTHSWEERWDTLSMVRDAGGDLGHQPLVRPPHGGDDAELGGAGLRGLLGRLDQHRDVQPRAAHGRGEQPGLRAEMAVFGTAAGLEADDALDLDLRAAPAHPHLVGQLQQVLQPLVGQPQQLQHLR